MNSLAPVMPVRDEVISLRSEEVFHVQPAVSAMNEYAGIELPQNPGLAPNNFGSPHQDSWCSESVSLSGPTGEKLLLIEQFNEFGYTPNMVCNSQNQMIGVSLNYLSRKFSVVVFDNACNIISATPVGTLSPASFGGGYFYLDNNENTVIVQDNQIASYPTQKLEAREEIYPLVPNWKSTDIIKELFGSSEENTLYANLPVWDESQPNLYWCLIAGKYDYDNYPDSTQSSPACMALVEVVPDGNHGCSTTIVDSLCLDRQWNNNTFAVDEEGAYIVTNGLDKENRCNEGYLWAFGIEGNKITVRWKTSYQNAGYLKPGQKNIGSGTTPTLTETDDGTKLVAITDNADPQLNVVVCNRDNGSIISETPCFEKMRSADEASLIGVGNTFVAENNFGHYPTFPNSQYVPNGPGMTLLRVFPEKEGNAANAVWDLPDTHFYAMNMLCRESGIIFAHTCDWSDDISATKGGMYYVSAIDAFNGHIIWRIPLGRGVDYCHEYGGIYFNHNGDLFIGTNQYLACIKNFTRR